MSETSKLNILQRLNAVRGELSYVRKDQKKIDNQYTAVRYDDVVEAAHALFVKHGIITATRALDGWQVVDVPRFKEGKQIGFYTRLQGIFETTFYNVDDTKDFLVASAPGFGLDPGDKGAGKAHTYGTKSNLLKTLFLVTGDQEEERYEAAKNKGVEGDGDAGGNSGIKQPKSKSETTKTEGAKVEDTSLASAGLIKTIKALAKAAEKEGAIDEFLKGKKLTYETLTKPQAAALMAKLTKTE